MTTLEKAHSQAGANNVVDPADLLAKSLAKRKSGGSADVGTRSTAATANMAKAKAKTSTRRRA